MRFYRLLAALVLSGLLLEAQNPSTLFHVAGAAIPGSLTTPTPIEQGVTLNHDVNIITITLTNKSGSSQTVTVQDCQVTPFTLMSGTSIAAGTTYVLNLNGIRFVGCIKWSASATSVMGSIVGQ